MNTVDWHLLHSAGDSVEFPGASHSVRNRKSPTLHPMGRDWSRSRLMSAPLLLPLPPPTARVERQRDTSLTFIPIETETRRPTTTVSTNTSFRNCHFRTRR